MHEQDETSTKLYILLTLVFLICYIVLAAMLEHKKYPVHRSTVAILVGIVAGFVLHVSSPASYNTLVRVLRLRVNWIKCSFRRSYCRRCFSTQGTRSIKACSSKISNTFWSLACWVLSSLSLSVGGSSTRPTTLVNNFLFRVGARRRRYWQF